MKRSLTVFTLLLAFALVAAACSSSDEDATTTTGAAASSTTQADTPTTAAAATTTTAADTSSGETTLIIGTTDAISSLDGSDAYAVHDWELLKNVGEGLLRWEPGSGDKLVAGSAEDFGAFSDDGLSYTIKLKSGQLFGDGTPLTASGYAAQINDRLLVLEGSGGVGPALGQPYLTSVEAVDDLTIKFNLSDTWGFFEQLLAGAPYIPLNPTQFPAGADAALVEFPEAPIYGNGPWYIDSYFLGETTVLKPNPKYQGSLTPQVDQVIIRYFDKPEGMRDALLDGSIDVAWRILGPDILAELQDAGFNVETVAGGAIRYFIVNHTRAPSDDPNVYKAIASLIDRDDISDRVFAGFVEPLYSPVPVGFLGATEVFDDLYGSPDIPAAQALLEASGYTADSPLQLEVAYPPEHYGGTVADSMQVISEQLEASGAIEVTLVAQEWSEYIGAVIGGVDYSVSLLGWFYDYPDPDNYLTPFVANGGLGTMITDPDTGAGISAAAQALADKIAEAAANGDQAIRKTLYEEAQAMYAELVVTLPLWFEAEHIVYGDNVAGSDAFGSLEQLNIGATIEYNYATNSKG